MNFDAAVLCFQHCCRDRLACDLESLYSAVDYFVELGDLSYIEKVVKNHSYRPLDIIDQHRLLFYIWKKEGIPISFRLYALIASSHKAMEAVDNDLVNLVHSDLQAGIKLVDKVGYHRNIRLDKNHLIFSLLSVYSHINLFLCDFENFFKCTKLSIEIFIDLDRRLLGEGYFQTCTNVSRCIGFDVFRVLLESQSRKEILDGLIRSARVIRDNMALGLSFADFNQVKGREFTRDLAVFNDLCVLLDSFKKKQDINKDLFRLYMSCVRPQGEKKVQYFKDIYEKEIVPKIRVL